MTATKNSLATALKTVRTVRGLSQEAFSDVSSRTYVSALERGVKNVTLTKLDQLCDVMKVHPLTLLSLAYGATSTASAEQLLARVHLELSQLRTAGES